MTAPRTAASLTAALPYDRATASHAAFLEEIARRQARSLPWHPVAIGLATVRLAEAWADGESCAEWGNGRIERNVEALPQSTGIREPLIRLVRAVNQRSPRRFARLAAPLAEYARALEDEATWQVAADVYQMIVRRMRVTRSEIVVRCYVRLGRCYLHLNCHSLSGDMFELGRRLAARRGDVASELLAEMGLSRLVMLRGNIPLADAMIHGILRRAHGNALVGVRSRALHQAADVALFRKDWAQAAKLFFEAFSLSDEESERYRILNDLALALLKLQLYDAARDAHLVVASDAPEQVVRWAAYLNLLEIESLVGDRAAFERYAKLLEGSSLPPELVASFQLQLGEGLLRFGDNLVARDHLRRALAMAAEFGLNEWVLDAERLLAAARLPSVTPPRVAASDCLDEIVSAIRGLRL